MLTLSEYEIQLINTDNVAWYKHQTNNYRHDSNTNQNKSGCETWENIRMAKIAYFISLDKQNLSRISKVKKIKKGSIKKKKWKKKYKKFMKIHQIILYRIKLWL